MVMRRKVFMMIMSALFLGCTGACVAVVRWLTTATQEVERCLDGNNLELFRLELGTRLHRTILDHLLRQEYNTAGTVPEAPS
jgi:hypothetical protein